MSTLEVTSGPGTDQEIQWLLEGDPCHSMAALRDLAGAAELPVERERRSREGWGACLLARQARGRGIVV